MMLIVGIGFGGGVLSGLLGIGGGILLAPLLLYLPPACRQPTLSMQVVSGLTIVQSLFAGLSGALVHHERSNVHLDLAMWLGGAMVVTSFSGAWWSGTVNSEVLLRLFAILTTVAAGLMLVPRGRSGDEAEEQNIGFSRTRAVAIGIVIGFAGGMVGQSGAFLVIPAMIHLLGIPLRTAIGTTLAVVVLAALAGSAGKLAAGQIVWPLAVALVPAAIVGAQVGARWGGRIRPSVLRHTLAAIIATASIRIWYDLLVGL